MNARLFLLLVITFCLCLSSMAKPESCEKKAMRKCNAIVKRGLQHKKGLCSSMKQLLNCVNKIKMSSAGCNTDALKDYRFVVLAYVRMDDLMGICSLESRESQYLQTLRESVLGDSSKWTADILKSQVFSTLALPPSLSDKPLVSLAAKDAHKECMGKFTSDQSQPSDDICSGLRGFIDCYKQKQGIHELTDAFYDVISRMSASLVKFFGNANMCNVVDE
ncbi:uncharacterized protein LOC116615375 isoform X2 [Nematostella vectensis]|nr:uncharacterized protein LOC116615375 isoform X2 [Nematostella vectensis]